MILNLHHISRVPQRLQALAPLTHLGTPRAAMERASSSAMRGKPLTLYEVAFDAGRSLRTPDLNDNVRGHQHSWIRLTDLLHYDLKRISARERDTVFQAGAASNNTAAMERLVQVLNDQGFDSIVYTNAFEHAGSDSFIVLDPVRARIVAATSYGMEDLHKEAQALIEVTSCSAPPLVKPRTHRA